jgi:DNA-directed RNA polymerase subunit E'/Rpb7
MNSDIKNNMKIVLKKKIEKKCNKNGFVDEVYRILEYSDGIMPAENLNGSAIYNITYHCKICIPVENSILLGQVKVINQELIIAINGPIMFFIPKENVDTNTWDIADNYLNKNAKRKLLAGDYIKIHIMDKRINQNDTQIKAIGKLIDFATPEEVDKFFGTKVNVSAERNNDIDNPITSNSQDKITEANTEEPDTESNFII